MDGKIEFGNSERMGILCGANDRNIPYLETLLNCSLYPRGTTLEIRSENPEAVAAAEKFLTRLSQSSQPLSETEIFMEYRSFSDGVPVAESKKTEEDEVCRVISVASKSVFPKTSRQKAYINAMGKKQIVFAIGPAGTGKTFLAVSHALSLVLSGKRQKILLTRPVVEAGESLGFLPGDLAQKLNPYLRPLYDAMEALLPPLMIKKLEESGAIEIAPLAYMRGRSLHNSVVILDEAQNTTREQMQMFLTRIGENSSAVVTGDISQIDLPKGRISGLVHASKILSDIPEIAFVRFDSRDVVRARVIQKIIDAYQKDAESEV